MEASISDRIYAVERRQAGQNVLILQLQEDVLTLKAEVAELRERLTPSEQEEFDALKRRGSYQVYGGVKEPRRNLPTLRALRRLGGARAPLPSERPW